MFICFSYMQIKIYVIHLYIDNQNHKEIIIIQPLKLKLSILHRTLEIFVFKIDLKNHQQLNTLI